MAGRAAEGAGAAHRRRAEHGRRTAAGVGIVARRRRADGVTPRVDAGGVLVLGLVLAAAVDGEEFDEGAHCGEYCLMFGG